MNTQDFGGCGDCAHRGRGLCGSLVRQVGLGSLLARHRSRHHLPGDLLYEANEPCGDTLVLKAGWAVSFALLPDGRRQLFSLLLPGDTLSALMLHRASVPWSFLALTDVVLCRIELDRSVAMTPESPLAEFLSSACAEEVARYQSRIIDLGARRADARLASFLLDLDARLRALDGESDWHPLFMRQYDLADMLGISTVHVSRVLSWMKRLGVLDLRVRGFRIVDHASLRVIAGRD